MTPDEETEYLRVASGHSKTFAIALIAIVVALVGFALLGALWVRHFLGGEWIG